MEIEFLIFLNDKRMQKIGRIILAIIFGELILILGTILIQEVVFGGIGWHKSSPIVLALGGLGSFLAAVFVGMIAFYIVKKKNVIPLIILSLLVMVETYWIIQTGRTSDPLWFDVLASASLIVGFWVGKIILEKYTRTVALN